MLCCSGKAVDIVALIFSMSGILMAGIAIWIALGIYRKQRTEQFTQGFLLLDRTIINLFTYQCTHLKAYLETGNTEHFKITREGVQSFHKQCMFEEGPALSLMISNSPLKRADIQKAITDFIVLYNEFFVSMFREGDAENNSTQEDILERYKEQGKDYLAKRKDILNRLEGCLSKGIKNEIKQKTSDEDMVFDFDFPYLKKEGQKIRVEYRGGEKLKNGGTLTTYL